MREIDKNELEKLRKKAEVNSADVNTDKRKRKRKAASKEDEINYDVLNVAQSKDKDANIDKKKIKKDKKKKEKKTKKMKKAKEPFSLRKFLVKLMICILIASFVCIVLFYFVDRFIYNLEHTSSLEVPITGLQSKDDVNTGIKIDSTMSSLQYSYNNKYYTFLKEGKVYIKAIATNADVAVVEAENEICYYNLLYDKNLIFYITKKESQYSTYLQIWTYEMSSGKTSEYNEFTVSGFSRIKDLEYSPLVNIIYLNVERTVSGKPTNVVYRIDLFNNMTRYASNMIVDKMVMLKQTDKLYFEDGTGLNYYAGYVLRIFNESVDLIGLDLDDKVYFISADRTKIYVTSGKKILNTINLEDTNIVTWHSDNTNVYLIYSDYVLNISSKEPLKKVAKMSKYVTFQTIKGDTMYLLTKDNRVVTTKINT